MQIIAEEANPFFLRELYLDGCEKITDVALQHLVGKQKTYINSNGVEVLTHPIPDVDSFFYNSGQFYLHDFNCLATDHEVIPFSNKFY